MVAQASFFQPLSLWGSQMRVPLSHGLNLGHLGLCLRPRVAVKSRVGPQSASCLVWPTMLFGLTGSWQHLGWSWCLGASRVWAEGLRPQVLHAPSWCSALISPAGRVGALDSCLNCHLRIPAWREQVPSHHQPGGGPCGLEQEERWSAAVARGLSPTVSLRHSQADSPEVPGWLVRGLGPASLGAGSISPAAVIFSTLLGVSVCSSVW